MSIIVNSTLEQICLHENRAIISGPFGSNISSKYFVDTGIPVIRGNNLSLNFDKFYDEGFVFVTKEKADELKCYAYRDDLIFTAAGTIGQVGLIPQNSQYEEYVISNKQIRARIDTKKIDLLYAYYWYSSPWIKSLLIRSNKGSTVPLLTLSEVKDLPIVYPEDIQEQSSIVSIIEAISKKIKFNIQINDNLEQQVAAIYDYWFTQFDFPNDNGDPYCSSRGQMVWNDTLQKNIPERWKVQSVISNRLASVIKPGIEVFDTKTYLATADVKGTTLSVGTIIDYGGRESRANMQPSVNSVWFAKMKNSIKHLNLNKEMQPVISNTILSTGFCGLQCSEESFEYIASYIANPYFEIHKDMLAHGATQKAVNNDDLAGVHIIVPNDAVLHAYHEITQPIYAQISKNICENQELVKLRDWLLPMLMNGQATISN